MPTHTPVVIDDDDDDDFEVSAGKFLPLYYALTQPHHLYIICVIFVHNVS